MDQADGEGGRVFIHCHAEATSGDETEFLKSLFAAATAESGEWCLQCI